MDNKEDLIHNFINYKEIQRLSSALSEGQGDFTEKELNYLILWVVQNRLDQDIISLIMKKALKVKSNFINGQYSPEFEVTELGAQMHNELKETDAKLNQEGGDILKDMLKDYEDSDDS